MFPRRETPILLNKSKSVTLKTKAAHRMIPMCGFAKVLALPFGNFRRCSP